MSRKDKRTERKIREMEQTSKGERGGLCRGQLFFLELLKILFFKI
jgi:hypothetical protein